MSSPTPQYLSIYAREVYPPEVRRIFDVLVGANVDFSFTLGEIEVEDDVVEETEDAAGIEVELQRLLNKYSAETASGTPDFLLASYLLDCLNVFNEYVRLRAKWHGDDRTITYETKKA